MGWVTGLRNSGLSMPAFNSVPPNWDIREGLECAERWAIYQAMNLQARVILRARAAPSISTLCHIGVARRARATPISLHRPPEAPRRLVKPWLLKIERPTWYGPPSKTLLSNGFQFFDADQRVSRPSEFSELVIFLCLFSVMLRFAQKVPHTPPHKPSPSASSSGQAFPDD